MIESPGWVSVLNTTIAKYFRQEEVNILRSRVLLAQMESKGRISYGHTGTHFDWKVRFQRGSMTPYADGDVLTFARVNRHKTAKLNNDRAYVLTESMGHVDTLQNSGNEAIIKLWDTKATDMMEDIRESFCDELYIDGNATGNGRRIHGIESFLGASSTVGAPGYVLPSDTYAELSTVPGTYGGSWTNGTYPEGSGDPQYDCWSPILVDYTSPVTGAYSSATKTWPNTCTEAMRNLITSCRKQKAKEGQPDMLMLEETLFKQYKNAQEQYKQIPVLQGEALGLRSMGFDVLSFDNCTITTEFGMPANTGYLFNSMKMDLRCLEKQLFVSVGPIYNEETRSYRWALAFTGNLVCNPKFFGKLKNYGLAA